MGQVLSTPVTSQVIQRNGNVTCLTASSEMQGWRIQHEDAHIVDISYCSGKKEDDRDASKPKNHPDNMKCLEYQGVKVCGFFAVLDGHGGAQVSQASSTLLKIEVKKQLEAHKDGTKSIPDLLKEAFLTVDASLGKSATSNSPALDENILNNCGSTCTSCLVTIDDRDPKNIEYVLHFANLGDSRCTVTCLKGEGQEKPDVSFTTVDHKPSNEEEKARVEAAGGTVSGDEPARIDSQLAVSRAFGDCKYKNMTDPLAHKVIAHPTTSEYRFPWEMGQSKVLTLACDGIFDVVNNQGLAQQIHAQWFKKVDLGDVCKNVLKHCLELQSRDNMTCMLVRFIDGTDYRHFDDELEPGNVAADCNDHEIGLKYQDFARNRGFESSNPSAKCSTCRRFLQNMQQCPCRQALYCTRACQKKDWKNHRKVCTAAPQNAKKATPGDKKSKGRKST